MASAQDHAPAIKELSERRQQDPQPSPTLQPQTTQQTPSGTRDAPDAPRPLTGTSETLRESSPPRFSQLLGAVPGVSEPNPPRRSPTTSTATNPTTPVNHPNLGTGPTSNITVGLGGAQNAPAIQDRSQTQPTSFVPDRRQPIPYDPIRGETAVQFHPFDDRESDRRIPTRRVSVPRPRPVYSPAQDGNGNGNGPRGSPRDVSATGSLPDLQEEPKQPQEKTVNDRLADTLSRAEHERDKYKKQATQQSVLINGAIALQVIVGAITTGVAAASKNIGAAVAVLGGMSTALASYLAKARGSGEPEFSSLRSRELSTFIRELKDFLTDNGHKPGSGFDHEVMTFRGRFELIIKTEGENSTSGTTYASNGQNGGMRPMGQQGMPGGFGGNNYQAVGTGQLSEKQQMWRNDKGLGGMV